MALQAHGAEIQVQHVSYVQRLEQRLAAQVQLIVIHATETPDLAYARELAEVIHYPRTQTGNSGHYYVDVDGTVYEYVPVTRVAHHVSGHNSASIGIELVNKGRYPHWFHAGHQQWTATYPQVQLDALRNLVAALRTTYPAIQHLARHSDLDQRLVPAADKPQHEIRRKLDPGATFPWPWLLQATATPAYAVPRPAQVSGQDNLQGHRHGDGQSGSD